MSQEEINKHLREYKTINRIVLIEEIDIIIFKEQIKYEQLLHEGELLREGAGGVSACVSIRKAINKLRQDEISGSINL